MYILSGRHPCRLPQKDCKAADPFRRRHIPSFLAGLHFQLAPFSPLKQLLQYRLSQAVNSASARNDMIDPQHPDIPILKGVAERCQRQFVPVGIAKARDDHGAISDICVGITVCAEMAFHA